MCNYVTMPDIAVVGTQSDNTTLMMSLEQMAIVRKTCSKPQSLWTSIITAIEL